MARTVLPFVGAAVGFWIGGPTGAQVGFALGGVVGNAVDPVKNVGPRIGETGAQTSAEGAPRAIIYGTVPVTGNVIASSALIKGDFEEEGGKGGPVNVTERGFRTYAIRICEGPIAVNGVLRVWEDDKLVFDRRVGSTMLQESTQWLGASLFYWGDEGQLPDVFMTININEDTPAYRGTAYFLGAFRDLTDRRGSIPQYRFEVAREVGQSVGSYHRGPDSTGSYTTHIAIDENENPVMLQNQTGDGPEFGVGAPGTYEANTYDKDDFTVSSLPIATDVITNAQTGSDTDKRIWPIAIDAEGYALSFHGNVGLCMLVQDGAVTTYYKPTALAGDNWWYNEGGYYPEYGGLAWFRGDVLYLGIRMTNGIAWDRICKFPRGGGGLQTPQATAAAITGDAIAPIFWMHVSRTGIVRAMSHDDAGVIQLWNEDLDSLGTLSAPAAVAARFPSTTAIMAFGVDDEKGMQAYMWSNSGVHFRIYNMAGVELAAYTLTGASASITNVIKFTSDAIYIQTRNRTFKIDVPSTFDGSTVLLSDIVSDIHSRCGVNSFDVSELDDEVGGLVLAGEYSGADAINTLRGPFFFDKAEADGSIWYPKRGAAVVDTLTIDDMIDEPDSQMREQAIEYPKKFHLFYQHANSGYAVVKATSQRSSPDARVVGEVTAQVPVVFAGAEDEAAQTSHKMHKVAWAEAEGEIKFSVPWSFIARVPSNPIGMSLRGRVNRLRITQMDLQDGVIDVTCRHDRQSAYTSNVTGVPIPDPTPPPATIVGSTVLAVLDIPSRLDSEDDLNIYYGVTGAQPAWHGAVVQRSLDAGANWAVAATIPNAQVIGELLDSVADASEHFTDTTNSVHVRLYRDTQSLESISNVQFLSEGGAFALESASGEWEIMQARDWVEDSNGDFTGTTLHRGRLDSTTSAHVAGQMFVMLDRVTHVLAESSWIGQTITHRAPSLGQSPEEAIEQSETYDGRSQLEWPVASMVLARDGADIITATWAPRHRFGTDDAPVASINFRGFRVTLDDGVLPAVTFDTVVDNFTYDASALGSPLTVSVSAINRITGAGPATSGSV